MGHYDMPIRWMSHVIRWKVLAGFLLLLMACILTVMVSVDSRQANGLVNQSMRIRHAISELFGDMRDAENGQRGYLLMGETEYLRPYLQARSRAPKTQSELRSLLAHDPKERALLDQLDVVMAKKWAVIELTIERRRANDQASALAAVKAGHDQHFMDRIRQLVSQLDADETQREAASMQRAEARQQ